MVFTFSQLAQEVWADLGRVQPGSQFLATGGSATTIINTVLGTTESPPEDNYALDYTAIVVRDAAGAGASPEGRLARVSAYNSSNFTYTVDSLTDAVASGDEIQLADADIPLREMLRSANRALLSMGEVESVDSSLSLNGSHKYSLPVGINREYPIRVEVDSSDGLSRIAFNSEVSADGFLFISGDANDGSLVYVTYIGAHAKLTAYNSPISEFIHPELAIAATSFYAMRWLAGTQSGASDWAKQRLNDARQDYDTAKVLHPVRRISGRQNWFVAGTGTRYPGDQSAEV